MRNGEAMELQREPRKRTTEEILIAFMERTEKTSKEVEVRMNKMESLMTYFGNRLKFVEQ